MTWLYGIITQIRSRAVNHKRPVTSVCHITHYIQHLLTYIVYECPLTTMSLPIARI